MPGWWFGLFAGVALKSTAVWMVAWRRLLRCAGDRLRRGIWFGLVLPRRCSPFPSSPCGCRPYRCPRPPGWQILLYSGLQPQRARTRRAQDGSPIGCYCQC